MVRRPSVPDFLSLRATLCRSANFVEDLAWRRFKDLLDHAYRFSPFYRWKLKQSGIGPEDIKDRSDLKYLPVTERSDLVDFRRFIAEPFRNQRLHYFRTSGSTGKPVWSAFDTRGFFLGKLLLKLRSRLFCGMSSLDRIAVIEARAGGGRRLWKTGRLRRFSVFAPLEETAKQLERFNPSVLYGFPSFLRELAGKCRIKARLIFTSAELLDHGTREVLREAFDASIYDVYGCTEVKEIAWECPAHEGYHINADWVLVEFVRQKELPDPSIVVTPLYNYAMPLLRYRIGDAGLPLEGSCSCGCRFPRMRPTCGRLADYLTLPDGTRLSPYRLTCALEEVGGLYQYQVLQHRRGRLTVKIVTSGNGDSVEHAVARALKPFLGETKIEVERVRSLPRDPSGKFRVVRSEAEERGTIPQQKEG